MSDYRYMYLILESSMGLIEGKSKGYIRNIQVVIILFILLQMVFEGVITSDKKGKKP